MKVWIKGYHHIDGRKEPDYKQWIAPNALRRMNKALRMGVGAGCVLGQSYPIKSILVGTGIGCFKFSMGFTQSYLEDKMGSLSPTPFIQSTDNTIAGQIALALKCNGYNITYNSKGFAFENALLDAWMLSKEKAGTILVGGVDEYIEDFTFSSLAIVNPLIFPGEGASFFVLDHKKEDALAEMVQVDLFPQLHPSLALKEFLFKWNLQDPRQFFYGESFIGNKQDVFHHPFERYDEKCGMYFTNSAFGMAQAVTFLQNGGESAAVVNYFPGEGTAIIYLKSALFSSE